MMTPEAKAAVMRVVRTAMAESEHASVRRLALTLTLAAAGDESSQCLAAPFWQRLSEFIEANPNRQELDAWKNYVIRAAAFALRMHPPAAN